MKKVFTKRALMVLFVLMTFGMMALKANSIEGSNVVNGNDVENLMSPKFTPAPLPEGVNLVITTTEPLEAGVASFDTVYYGTVSAQEITYTLGFSGAITEADRNKIYTFAELSMLMAESWSGFDYFINNFKDVFYQATSLESNPNYAMYDQLFAHAWATSNTEGMLFGTSGVYNADTLKYYYVTGAEIEAGLDFSFRYTPSNKNYLLDEASFTIVSPSEAGPVTILAYEPDPLKKQVYYYFMGTNGYPTYPTIGDATVSMEGRGKEPFITIECVDLEGTTLSFDSVYYGHQKSIPATLRAEGLGSRNIITFAELYLLINNSTLISPNATNPFGLTDLVEKFHKAIQTDLTTAYDQIFTDVLTRNIQQLIPGATVDELRYYYLTKADLEAGVSFNFIYVPPSIDADNAATLQITSSDPQTIPVISSYSTSYPEAYALYNNYPQLLSSVAEGVQDIVINAVGYGMPGVIYLETTPTPLTPEGFYVCDSTYFGYVSDSVEYTIKGIGLEPGRVFSFAEMIALWYDNSTVLEKNTFPSDYISKFDKNGLASPFDLAGVDSVYNVYFQRAFNQAAKMIWGSTTGHVYQDLQYYWIESAELEAGISFKVAYTPSAAYQVSSYSPSVVIDPVIDSAQMEFVDKAYDASLITALLHPSASAYDTAIYEIYGNYPIFNDVRVATIGNPLRSFISVETDITLDAEGYHTFEGVPFGCVSDSITYNIYGQGIQPDRTFTYVELAVLMADSSTAILTGNPFPSDYVDQFRKATPIVITTDMHDMFEAMWEGYGSVVTNLLGASYYASHDKTYADTLAYYYVTGQQLLDSINVKIAYSPSTPNLIDSARMWMLSTDVATACRSLMMMPEPKRTFYRSLYNNYPEMLNVFIGTKGIASPSVLTLTPHDINGEGYQYYDFGEVYYGYNATPTRNYQIKTTSISASCLDQQFSYIELLLLMDSLSWENYATGDPFPWTNLQTTFRKATQINIWKTGYNVLFDEEALLREAGKRLFGSVYTNAATKAELADTLKYYYVTSTELAAGINIEIGYTPTSTVSVDSARMVIVDPRDLETSPIFVANPTVKAIYDDYPLVDSVVIAVRGEGKPPVVTLTPHNFTDTTHFEDICVGGVSLPQTYTVNGVGFIPTSNYAYAEWLPLMADNSFDATDGDVFPSNYIDMFRFYNGDPLTPKPEMPQYASHKQFYDTLFKYSWDDACSRIFGPGFESVYPQDTLKYYYVSGAELNAGIPFNINFVPTAGGYQFAQMQIDNPEDASLINAVDPNYLHYFTNYPIFDTVILKVDGTGRQVVFDTIGKVNEDLSWMCESQTLSDIDVLRLQAFVDPLLTDGDVTYTWSSVDYPYAFASVDSTVLTIDLGPNVTFEPKRYHFSISAANGLGCLDALTIEVVVLPTKIDTICENAAYIYRTINIPANSLVTPKAYTEIGPVVTVDHARRYTKSENYQEPSFYYFADSLKTLDGNNCDSVYKLNLYTTPSYYQIDSVFSCLDNLTYTWNRPATPMVFDLTAIPIGYDSIVIVNLVTSDGCDSTWKLNLRVQDPPSIGNIIGSTYVYAGETQHYAVLDAYFIDEFIWDIPDGWMFVNNDTTDVQSVTLYVPEGAQSGTISVFGRSYGCGETPVVYFDVTVMNVDQQSITIIPENCVVCEYYDFGPVYIQDTVGPVTFTIKGTNLPNDKVVTYAELLLLMNDNSIVPANEPFPSNYISKFYDPILNNRIDMTITPAYDSLFKAVWVEAADRLGLDVAGDYHQLAHYYVTGAELNAGIPVEIYYHPSAIDVEDVARMEMENPMDASLMPILQSAYTYIYDEIYYDYPLIHNAVIAVKGTGSAHQPIITVTPITSVTDPYDFGGVYYGNESRPMTFTIYGQYLNPVRKYSYAELAVLMGGSYGDDEVFISNYVEKFHHYQPMAITAEYDALFAAAWDEAKERLHLEGADYTQLANYYVTGFELMNGVEIIMNYRPSSQNATPETARLVVADPSTVTIPAGIEGIYAGYPFIDNLDINVVGHAVTSYITVTPVTSVTDPYDFGGVYYGNESRPMTFSIYGEGLEPMRQYSYAELAVLMGESYGDDEVFISNYVEKFHHYQPMAITAEYDALFAAAWDEAKERLHLEGADYTQLANYYVTGFELMNGVEIIMSYRPSSQNATPETARLVVADPSTVTIPAGIEGIYAGYPFIDNLDINVVGHAVTSYITVTPNDVAEPYDFGGIYLGETSEVRNYTIYGEGLDPMRFFSYAEFAILMADNSYGDDEIFITNYVDKFHHYQPMPVEGIYGDLFDAAFTEASQRLPITSAAELANYYVTGAELMQGIDITIVYKPAAINANDQARVKFENPEDASIVIGQPNLLNELFFGYPEVIDLDINVIGHTNQPVITVNPKQVFEFETVCYEGISEEVANFTFTGTGLDLNKSYSFAELSVLMDRYMNYTEGNPFPSNYVEVFYHETPMTTDAEYDALFASTFNALKPLMDLSGDDHAILAHYYVTAEELLNGVDINILYTPTDKFSFDTARMEITNNVAPFIASFPTIYANYPLFDQCIVEVNGNGTSPETQFYGNTVICEGESTVITAVDLNDNTFDWYRWQHSLENTSVITVSPTVTTTYYVEVMNLDGCFGIDSITIFVNPVYHFEEDVVICQNVAPYIWDKDGQAYSESGVYEFNPGTVAGCDSVFVLNLTVNPSYNYDETVVVCSNELPYEWHGLQLLTSGLYTAPFLTVNGCDSIYNIDFTVNQAYNISFEAAICDGENYTENGFNLVYPRSGVYTQNLQTVNGCDSIITLTLTVNPNYVIYTTQNVCDSYTWNGITYTTDGVYTQDFVSSTGCDSMVILVLHVSHSYYNDIYVDICAGESYEFCGQTLTTNAIVPCYGTSVDGCDSILTLHLTVHPLLPAEMLIPELCEGSVYQDNDFIVVASMENVNVAPNIISDTAYLTTIFGCDSIRILNLTVLQPPAINYLPDVNICMGDLYEFYGQQITTTGIYTAVLTANNGCDSLIQVNVTVYPIPIIIIDGNTTICSGESTTLTARPFTGPNSNYEYLWVKVNIGAPNDTVAINEPTINTGALINDGSLPASYIYIASIRHTLTGCVRETNVTVTVNPLPNYAQIHGPSLACEGETITLTASGAQTYIWNNGQTGEVISITPTTSMTIGMRATNVYGCSTPTGTWIEHAITVNAAPAPILSGVGEAYVISLSWTNTDAEEYWIYRDNNLIAITETTTYVDEQIIQGIPYCYTVVAFYGLCQSVESNEICTRSTSVAIDETDNVIDYQLYPNPANNLVTIKGENMKVLNVYNTLGQKVETINVAEEVAANLDVTSYESGMYIIRIETKEGSIVTKRMIVVH